MCGIVGGISPGRSDLPHLVALMSATVAHRGPDDEGLWSDPDAGVALGHRRLSIIDVSDRGHQPMVSADGRWVLVLNGEIYDFADHRPGLESSGIRFRGHADTEVLLELIARDGVRKACQQVDGMFAFAAWDRQQRELWLARDRMGEKPLFHGRVGEVFAYASELSALRRLPGAPTAPDHDALAEFLRLGFVPAPHSILPGIAKVPAGCLVRVTGQGHADAPEAYWSLTEVAAAGLAAPIPGTEAEWIDRAEQTLRTSVRRRLVADVPVGAFLSGGLDSTTIVALAQQVNPTPVRTFTVAVGGDIDESDAAAAVAKHLGTEHTTLPLPELDALALAQRVADTHDEPFADPSAIPTTLLCAAAREHVTVALSGDGADELLGGYNRYRVADARLGGLRRFPPFVRHGLAAALTAVGPGAWDRIGGLLPGLPPSLGTKVHKLARVLGADTPGAAYAALTRQWNPADLLVDPRSSAEVLPGLPGATALQGMMLADQLITLPDNMLVKVDRASMAVALEVRVPFLDHRFVELTWRLPDSAKVRGGQGKWLIRQILGAHVPGELWQRPKVGFDPPLAEWLRGPLKEWSHDLLSPDRLRRQGLLRPEPVARALAAHDRGRENLDYPLWTLLMLQSWLEGSGA